MGGTQADFAVGQLKNLQRNADQARRTAELTVANRIAEEAKINAPGNLGSKISVEQTETTTTVIGGANLSAYIEFGTGDANVTKTLSEAPEGFQAIMTEEAAQFFVSGKGNLSAKPFFFPAIFANEPDIIPEVEAELLKLTQ